MSNNTNNPGSDSVKAASAQEEHSHITDPLLPQI